MDLLANSIKQEPVLSSLIVGITIGIVVLLYYVNRNAFAYWDKRGIRGPRPWPLIGNFGHLLLLDRMKVELEWPQKYGKVYGIYQGVKPTLTIADAEVLQQICVKDFDAFPNHDTNEFFNHFQKSFLFMLQDEHWKRARAIMSPTFTSGKIKRMFRLLDACADDLVACFDEHLLVERTGKRATAGVEVNVKEIYNLFSMDAITTCCYGLKLERLDKAKDLKSAASRNDFVQMALEIFKFSLVRFFALVCLPKSLLRACGFELAVTDKYDKLAATTKHLIETRRKSTKRHDDYLQLLLDAKLDDEMDLNEMDLEENHHAGLTQESLREDQKKLTDEVRAGPSKAHLSELEIVSGAMFLLIVGLETTASLLTHCTYLLAFNPVIQEKLHSEVKRIAEFKDSDKSKTLFTYDKLTSCHYLDSVLSETLRIFTSVMLTDRKAKRDYRIEKYKVDIPAGSQISLALYAVMNDPDYWPEPHKFNPDRFMPGNKEEIVPGSYCPFGLGPRHCIGMRFSLTESKLALAKMIMNYRFERAPGTSFPPELKTNLGLINLKKPNVIIVPR